jgi:hypothetical protein
MHTCRAQLSERFSLGGLGAIRLVGIRRGPLLPAIGTAHGRREADAHYIGLFLVARLLRVENAREQNPGQFRHILQGAAGYTRLISAAITCPSLLCSMSLV